jgi:hypothetical protein
MVFKSGVVFLYAYYKNILQKKTGPKITETIATHGLWLVNFIQIYIMFGRGICEKYQSRDEKFPEQNGEGNLVSRLVYFANTPPKHDISV